MRFIASQMNPALFDQTTIDINAIGKSKTPYIFRATGTVLKFDGFLKVYEEGKDEKDEEDEDLKHKLPAVTEGEALRFKEILPEQHFTEPPPRYNEATLVKKLEADGVGRPSTYASILSTIQDREYVKKEGGKFVPTELGMVVTDLLLESFNDIFDVNYTARMEEELDDIEEGKLDWRVAMGEFYKRFTKDLEHAERHMTDIKRMEKPTDLICEKCGKPMVIKWGKHGSFIACTGYPECTNTRELTVDLSGRRHTANLGEQDEQEYCENCGRPMVLKKGRFGTFFACSGYPECKTTKQIGGEQRKDVPLEKNARRAATIWCRSTAATANSSPAAITPPASSSSRRPSAWRARTAREGEVVERRSKRGRTFFGCNRYPECDFVAWGKPLPEKCPECGSAYMIEKFLKPGPWLNARTRSASISTRLKLHPKRRLLSLWWLSGVPVKHVVRFIVDSLFIAKM